MNILKDWVTWVILGEVLVAVAAVGAYVVAVTRH
jgi:hypothetical protein